MASVEEILDKNKIFYRYQGADIVIRCLNPDHPDNNPSLRIDKLTGIAHCFSCNFSDNIFRYFGEYQNTTSLAALRIKEKIAQIQQGLSLKIPKDFLLFDKNYRGIKASTYNKFGAFTTNELGLEDRLVFPIYNVQNQLYLFNARYMHSGFVRNRYMLYPRHVEIGLYPYNVEPINSSIILVEGIMDCINLHDKGLTNAVCIFGSRTKYEEMRSSAKARNIATMLNYLLPFYYKGVKTLHVLFDNDKSGIEASEGMYEFESHFNINIITNLLTEGDDPGGLLESEVLELKNYLYPPITEE